MDFRATSGWRTKAIPARSATKAAALAGASGLCPLAESSYGANRTTTDAVRQAKPGTKLLFHIRRGGREQNVTVKVGVLPFSLLG